MMKDLLYSENEIDNLLISGIFHELLNKRHRDLLESLSEEAKAIIEKHNLSSRDKRRMLADKIHYPDTSFLEWLGVE